MSLRMALRSETNNKRPSNAKLLKIHERLMRAATALEREAIYEEVDLHPGSLRRWFKMLGLEKLAHPIADPKIKRPKREPVEPLSRQERESRLEFFRMFLSE